MPISKNFDIEAVDIEDNAFDIEDSSISGGSHIPYIGHFSFLGASISNITVFDIGIYSSISKINIIPYIEARHLSFDIEDSRCQYSHIPISGIVFDIEDWQDS